MSLIQSNSSAIIKAAAKKGGTTHARDILNKVLDTRTSWLETDVPNALDWCINAVSAIIEYFERNKARYAMDQRRANIWETVD